MVRSAVRPCVTKCLAVPTNVWAPHRRGHLAPVPTKPKPLVPAEPETLRRHTFQPLLRAAETLRRHPFELLLRAAVLVLVVEPVVKYIAPAPAVSHVAPVPVVECCAPAVSCCCRASGGVHRTSSVFRDITLAPVDDCSAPAPAVDVAAAPAAWYILPAPVGYTAPSPGVDCITPLHLSDEYIAPMPAAHAVYAACAPVVEYIAVHLLWSILC